MQQRYEDCHCEDYPCCGHYDILYGDEGMPEYCDQCGGHHRSDLDCMFDDDEDEDTDDEDVIALREPKKVRVNAFGQRLREDAPELPGDRYEDAHLDTSWEERYEE